MAATRFWLRRLAACFKSPDVMGKPVNGDMQCRAIVGGATKKTVDPEQCPYQRTEQKNDRGTWSVYCLGHRGEMLRQKAAGEVDYQGDRAAPVTIRTKQTKRDPWTFPGDGKWKRGDPI